MKNPEEYLDEVHFHKNIRNTLSKILSPDGINDNMYERLLKALNLIQKDAYNQAVEDADEAIIKSYNIKTDRYDYNGHNIYKLKIK